MQAWGKAAQAEYECVRAGGWTQVKHMQRGRCCGSSWTEPTMLSGSNAPRSVTWCKMLPRWVAKTGSPVTLLHHTLGHGLSSCSCSMNGAMVEVSFIFVAGCRKPARFKQQPLLVYRKVTLRPVLCVKLQWQLSHCACFAAHVDLARFVLDFAKPCFRILSLPPYCPVVSDPGRKHRDVCVCTADLGWACDVWLHQGLPHMFASGLARLTSCICAVLHPAVLYHSFMFTPVSCVCRSNCRP